MYSQSFVLSMKDIYKNLEKIRAECYDMSEKKASKRLDKIMESFSDLFSLLGNISINFPKNKTDSSQPVRRYLEVLYNSNEIKIDDISNDREGVLVDSELFEIVNNYVLIPVGSEGQTAFNWIPLLELLSQIAESINSTIKSLMSRVNTDCDKFDTTIWTGVKHAANLLALRVLTMYETNQSIVKSNPNREIVRP